MSDFLGCVVVGGIAVLIGLLYALSRRGRL